MSIELTALSVISSATVSSLVKILRKSKQKGTLADIKQLIEKIETRTALSHEKAITKLKKFYQTERLVLVLGAGVSIDYGLPSWNTLLQRLIAKTFKSQDNQGSEKNVIIAKLFNMVIGPNALIAARYLALHFKDLEKKTNKELLFEEAIREALYESLDARKKVKDL